MVVMMGRIVGVCGAGRAMITVRTAQMVMTATPRYPVPGGVSSGKPSSAQAVPLKMIMATYSTPKLPDIGTIGTRRVVQRLSRRGSHVAVSTQPDSGKPIRLRLSHQLRSTHDPGPLTLG
jgi:hypothetical protein